ncbi:MAG: excinuclease ABC subunit UvrC [Gaiellales bacterium]
MATGVDLIRERARLLPDDPGVYVYRDQAGDVLYVGKAKSLRKRVGSYARPDRGLERKTAELVLRVADIDVTVTGTETEALLLEQTLVKQHRPPFNVRLRDDKSYPMIAVTTGEAFPRVLFTRRGDRRNARLFGPYPSASKVRETLDVLNRVFPFRPCEGPTPGRRSGSPCLDFHIGRCLAPCVGKVSEEDYGALIGEVIRFLEGDTVTIRRQLEAEMERAAAEQRYEDAARARNRLAAVRLLDEQQLVDRTDAGDADVLGIALGEEVAVVHVWPQRGGRMAERIEFVFDNTRGATLDDVLEAVVDERYGAGVAIPPLVVVPPRLARADELHALLADRRDAAVELRSPARGEWRRLQELAQRNAELACEGVRLQDERTRTRGADALEELRDALGLEGLPRRIECYDISTLGGEHQFASMVVFQDGVPRSDQYRSFAIRHGALDDFKSMAEVITRRFTRLAAGDEDASFAAAPDLVVIDGGKGQLNAAVTAMRGVEAPRVAVIGLAKREEEVFVPGRSAPVMLDAGSPALLLLRQVRDEAHRFALRQNRRGRSNAATQSVLETIPGVGAARRKALLAHFGSIDAVMAATPEELEGVPGLPSATARRIHSALHRLGGASPAALPNERRQLPDART